MLNKIDKVFIISSIFVLVLLVLSLFIAILSMFDIDAFWIIIFANVFLILAFSGLVILAFLSTLNPLI